MELQPIAPLVYGHHVPTPARKIKFKSMKINYYYYYGDLRCIIGA